MFRRWAEGRMYRRTVQLAVSELRRAARTPSALEKLHALELAEQKLEDALWLCPEKSREQFEGGVAEVQRSRERALREQALPAVGRLLAAAEREGADSEGALEAAAELLCFLNHYLPEEAETEVLSARFRELGGRPRAYRPVAALSEAYQRPRGGLGCGTGIVGMVVTCLVVCWLMW